MEWYEELDFDENPFTTQTRYVGNENVLDEVFYSIVSGNILVLQGEIGAGKTRILHEVIRKFGGQGRVAYINCQQIDKKLNVERVIKNKNGVLGKLFKVEPKNMILLLDDVEFLSEKNMERIKYYFDRNHIRSIIFATDNMSKLNLNESIQQRIRKIITLTTLSDYEAVQVVRDKIGEEILNDRVIKETYHQSGKNMRKFLDNCELVCQAYLGNKELKEGDIETILTRGGK
jgi:predicted ATP-dependent serine protease